MCDTRPGSRVTRHASRVTNILKGSFLRSALVFTLLIATAACSGPGYYLQAGSGHWKLMRAREDISELVEDPATDPALVRKLETSRKILSFAGETLGLPVQDSYSEFVATGREAVAWNVVAAPEFSLAPKKWCFLVAGCIPYRGYFDEPRALKAAERLARKGLDVAVTPVSAYSTLGWFRDPVLDTMLAGSDTRLAATLIHELAHRRLYLNGETVFSVSFARFVERGGV